MVPQRDLSDVPAKEAAFWLRRPVASRARKLSAISDVSFFVFCFFFLLSFLRFIEGLCPPCRGKWDYTRWSSASAIWTAPASGRRSRRTKRSWTKPTGLSKNCTKMGRTSSTQPSVRSLFLVYPLSRNSCTFSSPRERRWPDLICALPLNIWMYCILGVAVRLHLALHYGWTNCQKAKHCNTICFCFSPPTAWGVVR